MSSYKLTYFNARGRAELSRLIFTAAGLAFTDNRLEFASWATEKALAPIGAVPYLEVNGGPKLPQSLAVARFIARECNLAGETNLQQAQADAIVDTITEAIAPFAAIRPLPEGPERAAAVEKWIANEITTGLVNLEKLFGLYGSHGFSVGTSLTWADLAFFDRACLIFTKAPEFSTKYPLCSAVYDNVAANERIAAYVANRPVTLF